MVSADLDSESIISTGSLTEDQTYSITEEFLLNNILLFSLKRGYTGTSEAVLTLCRQLSYKCPTLALWCAAAISDANLSSTTPNGNETIRDNSFNTLKNRLEILTDVGKAIISKLDNNSPYLNPLTNYIQSSMRAVLHFYLEYFVKSSDFGPFLAKLNEYFPDSDKSDTVQNFRYKFLKLLVAPSSTVESYLIKRWIPNRTKALENLKTLALQVTSQFPQVLLDKVGTQEWSTISSIFQHLETALALLLRQYFLNKSECTEADISEIIHVYNSQSIPSQLW